jgi:hypothetical protein
MVSFSCACLQVMDSQTPLFFASDNVLSPKRRACCIKIPGTVGGSYRGFVSVIANDLYSRLSGKSVNSLSLAAK